MKYRGNMNRYFNRITEDLINRYFDLLTLEAGDLFLARYNQLESVLDVHLRAGNITNIQYHYVLNILDINH